MRRRDILIRLGLLGGGLGAAWWFRDQVLWRRPDIDFGQSEAWLPWAERRVSTPTVVATLNGRPVRALIDSGAQYSVIDRSLMPEVDASRTFDMPIVAYGVGGQAQLGKGVTLDVGLGDTTLRGLRAAILDLGPLAARQGLGTPLILGQDVLGAALLDLDVAGRRLRLRPPGGAWPAEVREFPVRRLGTALGAQVSVEGATVQAVIDTGASAVLALGGEAAAAAGLLDGRDQQAGSSIVLGGAIASTTVTARTVTIGDQLFRNAQVAIFPTVALPGYPEALIGMEAFAGRRVVMDIGATRFGVSEPMMDLTVGPPAQRRRS